MKYRTIVADPAMETPAEFRRPRVCSGRVTPGEPCPDCVEYRRALQWISGYWLGPTAVCQVHVDHMKGIARRALGEPYV